MKKKLVIGTLTIVSLLSACTNNSVKTYPSITTPYEIINEEATERKNEGYSNYVAYQELKEVNVRDLTEYENEEFIKRMKDNKLNDLSKEYQVVEFYFGDMTMIRDLGHFYNFDENSVFVYDDEIVKDDYYLINEYDNHEVFYEKDNKDNYYSVSYENYRTIILLEKDLIKKGLQFKTKMEDETIYIDIK